MTTYRPTRQEQVQRIAREAAQWLQVLKAEPGAAEREAFASWLAASPVHVRELLLAGMLERELSGSGVLDGFDVEAVVARARASANVVALPAATPAVPVRAASRARHRRVRWLQVAAVVTVVLLGAAGWVAKRAPLAGGTQYATAIGERRAIILDDGTRVQLAPDSRITVDFSASSRRIVLRQGEAEFDVVHNAARPFRVYAGANLIQDIGTRFSVNRLPSGTVVAVSEGMVEVSTDHLAALSGGLAAFASSWLPGKVAAIERPGARVEPMDGSIHLAAGQQAHIAGNGEALTRGKLDVHEQAPSRGDRLAFHDDTLADIVAEFNRYNTPQIVIDGDALRLQRYSGVFDADDAASFLQFLDCCSRLAVIRHVDRWVIEARPTAASHRR